jgi:hypothetical protein
VLPTHIFATKIKRWDGDRLWHTWEYTTNPRLENLLTARDCLIVISYGPPPYKVVLGVPHQAALGVPRICERRLDRHGNVNDRKADHNVASFALVAFSRLRDRAISCKLVIMAHATTHDPNKQVNSPYCREIFGDELQLLFECHGSGPKRKLDLELSAGSNQLGQPVSFGRTLASDLDYQYSLGMQTVTRRSSALILRPGGTVTSGKLQLPAVKTASLIEAGNRGIPALHLEAKPRFRVPGSSTSTVSSSGRILGRAIAATISLLAG